MPGAFSKSNGITDSGVTRDGLEGVDNVFSWPGLLER
jgi:hypothetical protein